MDSILIPIIVFLLVYVAITFELVNKTVATFSGVAILVMLHIVSEHQAIELIDFETTGHVIKILDKHEIDFQVIPEYDLVHYFEQVNKLFIGTQALTLDNKLICDPGTSNIVSECHLNNIPVYLFLKSLKLSHFPASEQNIKKYETKEHHGGIEYKEIFYSNDIVELKLIDHIIMENGETSIDKIHDFSIH